MTEPVPAKIRAILTKKERDEACGGYFTRGGKRQTLFTLWNPAGKVLAVFWKNPEGKWERQAARKAPKDFFCWEK